MPAPSAWDVHEAARFRLSGFGGAAIFLRSQIQPARACGTDPDSRST